MNEENQNHPSPNTLALFVAGELGDEEMEDLLLQLTQDEETLRQVDELWSTQPLQAIITDVSEIDTETSQRVQRRLTREISRSNLAANVVKFGMRGFFAVAAGLLKPMLAPTASKSLSANTGNDPR